MLDLLIRLGHEGISYPLQVLAGRYDRDIHICCWGHVRYYLENASAKYLGGVEVGTSNEIVRHYT
jgi:hypothetical protein